MLTGNDSRLVDPEFDKVFHKKETRFSVTLQVLSSVPRSTARRFENYAISRENLRYSSRRRLVEFP